MDPISPAIVVLATTVRKVYESSKAALLVVLAPVVWSNVRSPASPAK